MSNEVRKFRKDSNDIENVIVPPLDIYETGNEYVIKADMPAVTKENLNITLHDNKLEIDGKVDDVYKSKDNLKYHEFTMYNFHRSFNISNDVDGGKINAKMDNGILTLVLPKKEEVKPRKIQINVG